MRDFFVCITTDSNKSYKLKTLKDAPESEWQDLLPFDDPTLVIDEFDTFDTFFALYAKRNGVPELIVQDLETGKFQSHTIDGEVGDISPSLNSNYHATSLDFFF